MKPVAKNIIFFVIALLILAALFSTFSISTEKPASIGIGTFIERIHAGDISGIEVRGDEVVITKKDGVKEVAKKEKGESLSTLLSNSKVEPKELEGVTIDISDSDGKNYFLSVLLPSFLPIILIFIVFIFFIRQMQGANVKALQFGQSGAREVKNNKKNRITFKDVAGVREAKEELMEVVDFLRNPKKFIAVGAKIPKGVLLMGHPGTGKTLLARAVAGEANVSFFHISGSEFVEMFVGVGASRVRDLFAKAKKEAPCIIFIDEIDAVGRQRGTGLGGSHDEREQTLNQILVEMDGFDPNIGVIVIAATNRPDVLDPALLRPGRFDRRVILDLPDINDREEILNIYAKNKPMVIDVNIRRVAERTPGFSGADLMNLLNEAAILCARRNLKKIGMEEILESIDKVLIGPARKSFILNEQERKITAFHEAGHALVAHLLPHSDPVHKISIISRGQAAGYTIKLPTEDRKMHTRAMFLDDMAVMLGGYVAENEIFGDLTTGPSDDLKRATNIARDLVTRFGMSGLGARTFGERDEMIFLGKEIHEQRDYSEALAQKIDEEINKLISGAKEKAETVIRGNKEKLEKIANTLLEKETIEKEAFEALMSN